MTGRSTALRALSGTSGRSQGSPPATAKTATIPVVSDQPVQLPSCPGAGHPPRLFRTDGKGQCRSCDGWYRVLRSGDVGKHRPRREVKRRHREGRDIASMIRRMIDALGRRAIAGDETDLRELVELRYHVELAIDGVVRSLHDDQEFSWTSIADIVGVTRQAARQRWGINDGT